MKIGIFSSFIEPAALKLVEDVKNAVGSGEIPDTEVAFIFSNREKGESKISDEILDSLSFQDTPVISYSAARFQNKERQQARKKEREGDDSLIKKWRNQYGQDLLARLPKTDLDLLLGDMLIWGDDMCEERNGINLHPALPGGPKGEWYKVIWQLIQERKSESGVMMHKVTPELDQGPAVAYCRYPIRGGQLDPLWQRLPKESNKLGQIIKQGLAEKEKAMHPLFREIRNQGFIRETPLIIQTTKAFAEGSIRIEGGMPVDGKGIILHEGYDLTSQIERKVLCRLEGIQNFRRKEVF